MVSCVTVLWFCFLRAGGFHFLLSFLDFVSETAYPADERGKNYINFTRTIMQKEFSELWCLFIE